MNLNRALELLEIEENTAYAGVKKDPLSLGIAITLFEIYGFNGFACEHDKFYGPRFEQFVEVVAEDWFIKLVKSGWYYDEESDCLARYV